MAAIGVPPRLRRRPAGAAGTGWAGGYGAAGAAGDEKYGCPIACVMPPSAPTIVPEGRIGAGSSTMVPLTRATARGSSSSGGHVFATPDPGADGGIGAD